MPAIIKKVQSLSKVYLAYVAEIWQNLQARLHQAHGACFFLAPYDDLSAFALRLFELFFRFWKISIKVSTVNYKKPDIFRPVFFGNCPVIVFSGP